MPVDGLCDSAFAAVREAFDATFASTAKSGPRFASPSMGSRSSTSGADSPTARRPQLGPRYARPGLVVH